MIMSGVPFLLHLVLHILWSCLGQGQLIPWMADRPMQWKKLRWKNKSGHPLFFILASRPYLSDYWPHKNGSPIKMSRISLGKQFCHFCNNLERNSFSKVIKKQKNALHWPNYIALQWWLPVLCLDPFLPDRPTLTFPNKKKIHMTGQFFLF